MNQIAKTKQALAKTKVRPMSNAVAEVRQNINLIHEALKATMISDVHYGVIPGCGKPSLYKAGAETLIALFKLTFKPSVQDLSAEGEIRYMVTMDLSTREGVFIGSGIGECSSGEEKYSWRKAICDREYEVTLETQRRIKFKKGYQGGEHQEIQQVRVPAADMANTILKMAKKRALIDAVLTATGASDIFSQDIESLPEEYISQNEPTPQDNTEPTPTPKKAEEAPQEAPQQELQGKIGANPISPAQGKRFYAIAKNAGMEDDFLKEWLFHEHGYESSKHIDRSDYENICNDAEVWKP